MNAQQKKALKRKERKKTSREKVLRRREALRKSRKEAFLQQKMEREAHVIMHGSQPSFIKDPVKLAEREAINSQKAKKQLEKNMEVLKALEAEYEREQANRAIVNDQLETAGYKTLKEKMDALHEKALQNQQKENSEKII